MAEGMRKSLGPCVHMCVCVHIHGMYVKARGGHHRTIEVFYSITYHLVPLRHNFLLSLEIGRQPGIPIPLSLLSTMKGLQAHMTECCF